MNTDERDRLGPSFRIVSLVQRKLFNLAAAVSLLLSLVAIVLGVRSEFVQEEWNLLGPLSGATRSHDIRLQVQSINGGIGVMFPGTAVSAGTGPPLGWIWYQRSPGRPSPTAYPHSGLPDRWPWHGFVFEHRGFSDSPSLPPLHYWFVTIPYWALVMMFVALPLVWTVRRRREAATSRRGCCPTCGYDLRATPDRCPECGTSPPVPNPAAL
jgi:hypothetical protein